MTFGVPIDHDLTLALAGRVLVLAPTGDDASIVRRVLEEHAFRVEVVPDLAALSDAITSGIGVAVIASEALDSEEMVLMLRDRLEEQEPWSELPVLFLGGSAQADAIASTSLLGAKVQVILLERPLGIATLLTATTAALRSRRRQYEVRLLLDQLAQSAVDVQHANEVATRAKDDFLATLAHELRSPMTAISGWVQMLKAGLLGPTESTTAIAMIESSARVQARIIEDLMDVSKIIAGKVMVDPHVVELRPIVENLIATFRPSAAQEQIELTDFITEERLFADVDAVRLQQVGSNLLSNAMKFTPRGGKVHVALRREGNFAVISVEDTGEGITGDILPHIFERYRQAEGAPSRPHTGLGLGLAIVRHLVENHGGTIRVESGGRNQGSAFHVSIPLHAPPY